MDKNKTNVISSVVEKDILTKLREQAKIERRTVSNLISIIIEDYYKDM